MLEPLTDPLISVIIPTYHRPHLLHRTVASVLAQETGSVRMEVIIAVSDASSAEDFEAAQSHTSDPRVAVTVAARTGPAAARNAALSVARGDVLAFIDDDCLATSGWLTAGLSALTTADLVQGHTEPEREIQSWHHTVWVLGLTYRWETCNLFVRREVVERAGLFDEEFNPLARPGAHWGEDTEWGWRLIRHGARPAYADDAVVLHAVLPRTRASAVEYHARIRFFPYLIRHAPEARSGLYMRYFLNSRHARVAASATLTCVGTALIAVRTTVLTLVMGLLCVLSALLLSYSQYLLPGGTRYLRLRHLPGRALQDLVEFAYLLYGSLRWRRIVV